MRKKLVKKKKKKETLLQCQCEHPLDPYNVWIIKRYFSVRRRKLLMDFCWWIILVHMYMGKEKNVIPDFDSCFSSHTSLQMIATDIHFQNSLLFNSRSFVLGLVTNFPFASVASKIGKSMPNFNLHIDVNVLWQRVILNIRHRECHHDVRSFLSTRIRIV